MPGDWGLETGPINFTEDSNQVSLLNNSGPTNVSLLGSNIVTADITSLNGPTYDVTPYGFIVMPLLSPELTANEKSLRITFERMCWDSADVRANYDVAFRDF